MAKIVPGTVYNIDETMDVIKSHNLTILQNEGGIKSSKQKGDKMKINSIKIRPLNVNNVDELRVKHPIIEQAFKTKDTNLANEDKRMAENAKERKKEYQSILLNEEGINPTSYLKGLYGFAGIAAAILIVLPIALIPYQDSIKDPSYFYESPLISIFCSLPMSGVVWVWEFSYIINMDQLRNFKTCAKVTFGLIISKLSLKGIIYIVWSFIKGYRYPMPFHDMLLALALFPPSFILLWSQCPKEWRCKKEFQRRFWYYISIKLVNIGIYLEYQFLFKTAFIITPKNWQWLLSLALLISREINLHLQMKQSYKAAGTKDDSVELFREHYICTQHCIFVTTAIGGEFITTLSTIILIGSDAVLNFYSAMKLVWMKYQNKIEKNVEGARRLLTSMMVNEIVEFVTAIAFLVNLLICYYGPNATLIANIKSSYFHNKPIANIDIFVANLLYFIFVDVLCIGITGCCLWIFSRINIIRANAYMQQEFWFMMAGSTAYWMNNHFNSVPSHNGVDFTFEFKWLQEKNSTIFTPINDTATF